MIILGNSLSLCTQINCLVIILLLLLIRLLYDHDYRYCIQFIYVYVYIYCDIMKIFIAYSKNEKIIRYILQYLNVQEGIKKLFKCHMLFSFFI